VAKESNLAPVLGERAKLLVEADDRRAARLRELKKEARKVSRNLAGT
jgi:hypothetical protein